MKTHRSSRFLQFAILAILAFMLAPVAWALAPLLMAQFHGGDGAALAVVGAYTLLDLAKLNTSDVVRPMIEETVGAVPEIGLFPAEQLGAGKLSYETLIRSGYPSTSFADMGEGWTPSKSEWRKEIFEVFKHGGLVKCPKDIADNNPRGGAAGLQYMEGVGVMKVAMFNIARQIYYGRGFDGKGFPGLKNFTAFGTTFTDPITGKVYNLTTNATGTMASTGSSVYFIKFSTDPTTNTDGVQLEIGTGSVFTLPDFLTQLMLDAGGSKLLVHYYAELTGFIGMMTPNQNCVRRICNLTADTGKGLTDALIETALAEFPQGVRPDVILMSQRSRRQLQNSRTVVLFGQGASRPTISSQAPVPLEYDGIPIVRTDALSDTEAIEVSAAAEE